MLRVIFEWGKALGRICRGDGPGCALDREIRIIRAFRIIVPLHIPLAVKVVITFRGQGSAGSFVGFEGNFFLR